MNGYDELGRLKERTLYESSAGLAPSGMLAKFEWSHDLAGNVTAQSEIWPGSVARGTGTTARTTAMAYDGANRLKTETVSDPVTGVTGTAYGYDAANNRQTKSVSGGSDPGYWDYAYNAANQLTGWTKKTSATGALLKTGTRTYDANGNCESSTVVTGSNTETQTYTWNSQGRLTGVEMPGGQEHAYGYDYRARRVHLSKEGGSTSGSTTAVVFGGGLSLAEYASEEPEPITANAPTVHYTRGPDMGGGVGGLLYSERGSAVKYNLNNGRGDIVAQSDAAATLTWTASYEAYGKRPLETGSNADKQRANSKDEDPTGLLNEGFRYRDLETGVWLSRDPAGFVDGPNLYAYVRQNPWTSFDPDGLQSYHWYQGGWLRENLYDPVYNTSTTHAFNNTRASVAGGASGVVRGGIDVVGLVANQGMSNPWNQRITNMVKQKVSGWSSSMFGVDGESAAFKDAEVTGEIFSPIPAGGAAKGSGLLRRLFAKGTSKIEKTTVQTLEEVSKLVDEVPEGVIYKRTDLSGDVKPYGGQAESLERYAARQKEHARSHPDADFDFEIVERAKPGVELDIAEHKFIQSLTGGIRAKYSPDVSNLKDPVGPLRRRMLKLAEPIDPRKK